MTLADWDPPLRKRRGGETRLCGLDVWHDFDWEDMFGHNRATFPGGQPLTEWLESECPEGKTVVLVLTANPEQPERVIHEDDKVIVVCGIKRYKALPEGANRPIAHFGGRLGTGIIGIARLGLSPDEIENFVRTQMNSGHVRLWAANDAARLGELQRIAGEADGSQRPASRSTLRRLCVPSVV